MPYRSLKFQHFPAKSSEDFSWKKGAVINECNQKPFNRTMDSSIYLNEQVEETILTRDFPEEHNEYNEAIYPKNFGVARDIYSKYKTAVLAEPNTIFLGRLATYKYLDMWMAVKQVLTKLRT